MLQQLSPSILLEMQRITDWKTINGNLKRFGTAIRPPSFSAAEKSMTDHAMTDHGRYLLAQGDF